ncbi:Sec-independent protein translocase protein TatB [Sphingomonas morindae]|uniref:Sec-independent protein translocase protein TatB n=1 Tax=Sphingomonas morindae TaxID=1541170 RepID=A0ABY4X8S6_9SPHN|nr:Sec-independent protein translocase protein TatB [Sphingomonas morindae]USI73300.1 Sec-independent protein translocase protein TatB [Sphingomonas morindae]
MFDIAPSEMLVVALVAIIFIGPKDLPRVMRFVGQWVGKGRSMARHFRSAMDEMVREAELAEMEKKWKEENERIMREHADLIAPLAPSAAALPAPAVDGAEAGDPAVPAQDEGVPGRPLAPPPETATVAPQAEPREADHAGRGEAPRHAADGIELAPHRPA